MAVYNTKVSKVEVGVFNAVDGTITGWTEIQAYKDTVKISESEPTATKHFQAGRPTPRKIVYTNGEETFKLSIMNTSAASLEAALGGTITTVATVDTWNKPKGITGEVIKALRITTGDGAVITVPRGSWVGVKNFDLGDTTIALIDITVTPTDTGFDLVPDVSITDPAA